MAQQNAFFTDRENPIFMGRELSHDPSVKWNTVAQLGATSGQPYGVLASPLNNGRLIFRRALSASNPLVWENCILKIGILMSNNALSGPPYLSAPDPFAICKFFRRIRVYLNDSGQELWRGYDYDLNHTMYAHFVTQYTRKALESHPALFTPMDGANDCLKFSRLASDAITDSLGTGTYAGPTTVANRRYNLKEFCPSVLKRYQKYVIAPVTPHTTPCYLELPLSDLLPLKGLLPPAKSVTIELDFGDLAGCMFTWSAYTSPGGGAAADDVFTVDNGQMRIISCEMFERELQLNPEMMKAYDGYIGASQALIPFYEWRVYPRALSGASGEIVIPNVRSPKTVMLLIPAYNPTLPTTSASEATRAEVVYNGLHDYIFCQSGVTPNTAARGDLARTYRFRATDNTTNFYCGLTSVQFSYGAIEYPARALNINSDPDTSFSDISEPFFHYKFTHNVEWSHPVFTPGLTRGEMNSHKALIAVPLSSALGELRLTSPADLRIRWTAYSPTLATPEFVCDALVLISTIRVVRVLDNGVVETSE